MSSQVPQLIERGAQLKRQTIGLVSAWSTNAKKTDLFPDFIVGEPHALGDLEIEIERWLNEAEMLTRGFLNAEDNKDRLWWALHKGQQEAGISRREHAHGMPQEHRR